MAQTSFHLPIIAFLGLTLLAPVAAFAQDANQDSDDATIEVIGRRQSEEQARKEANDFVRGTGVANGENPVARWTAPVCPAVLGIHPEYAAIVERKIRSIAQTAEIALAPLPCKTNIVVSFTTNASAVIQRVAKKSPKRIAEVPMPDRAALLKGSAPIRWWYTTQVTGTDGMSTIGDAPLASAGTAEGGGSPLALGAQSIQAYSSSIIRTQAVRALRSATVVIDITLSEGVPLDAVAAYSAMVAFAEVKPSQSPPPNSILSLFGQSDKPGSATDWDISFLKALYSIPAARAGWKQRRMLVGKILKDADVAGQVDDDDDLTEGLMDPK
ncbi:hypothetical protein [Blastomonas sp.]|uniref:hypothetical protein n=1 Tax=Blastomonas sp. TaxID=1909299 RepID=UPI00391B63EF